MIIPGARLNFCQVALTFWQSTVARTGAAVRAGGERFQPTHTEKPLRHKGFNALCVACWLLSMLAKNVNREGNRGKRGNNRKDYGGIWKTARTRHSRAEVPAAQGFVLCGLALLISRTASTVPLDSKIKHAMGGA
jgi:hypothetical protein